MTRFREPISKVVFRSVNGVRRRVSPQPSVLNSLQTVEHVVRTGCSLARFGDGELMIMRGQAIGFQRVERELSERLSRGIRGQRSDVLVCVPDVFGKLERFNPAAAAYWRKELALNRSQWLRYLDPGRIYGDALVTRFYMDVREKRSARPVVQALRSLWTDRDVVLIEGQKSRVGVENDLLDTARSTRRILCPSTNAFDTFGEVLRAAAALDRRDLLLLALGPTASVLVPELADMGFQALDVGHVDVEYAWWKMGATAKVPIPGKYVNEAGGASEAYEAMSAGYERQVIVRIGSHT